MITGEIKSKVDRIWDTLWAGGISNPLTVIEQLTYLLFIKRLDELHTLKENKANRLGKPIEEPIFTPQQNHLRWSRFKHSAPEDMFATVRDHAFPFIKTLGQRGDKDGEGGSTYTHHMKDALFMMPTPRVLASIVDQLDAIDMAAALAEQKRIAAILDAADALRAKRREALAQLDTLLQSTFLTLFGDPVTNPMGWVKPSLLELCSARQWPTISGSQLKPSGYPVYGANGQIGYYSKYNHEHPTVLVTCRGATCGTINICPPKCYVTGNAMALDDPDPRRITLSYLEWVLRIRGMNDVICGAAQPQITRTGMAPITIPLPPLPLQQKFAAIVESVERQKAAQRAHLVELDTLFAALQHRAFRGEL